jgi:hypothetical protein
LIAKLLKAASNTLSRSMSGNERAEQAVDVSSSCITNQNGTLPKQVCLKNYLKKHHNSV